MIIMSTLRGEAAGVNIVKYLSTLEIGRHIFVEHFSTNYSRHVNEHNNY